MRLSTRSRYCVRALLDIMVNGGGVKPVPLSKVAERQEVSEKYLEQIFIILKKANIVKATRGVKGGYILAKEPKEICLGDILRVTELEVTPVKCSANKDYCDRMDRCICKVCWDNLGKVITNFIDSITLEDIRQMSITIDEGMGAIVDLSLTKLNKEIKRLKKERDAVILVHNYQRPEVHEIADYLGDSLDLSRRAAKLPQKIIVFCGVNFMAESAKVLSPEKTVLIPRLDAGCPMADMITVEELREMKNEYPDAKVVCYVNTSADVKAESDICCTSANAVKVVESLKPKRIIFIPDKNLASYVAGQTKKEIIPWYGYCYVHEFIRLSDIKEQKRKHPDARVMVHPETKPEVVRIADFVLGTMGMINLAKKSKIKEFIVGTEEGLVNRMRRENPEKKFYLPSRRPVCVNMKRTRLEDVYHSLMEMKYKIEIEKDTIKKAQKALKKMIAIK
ncbi:MAG: quinolinate synthase NadA [Candidatus Cloacimonadota bacterium]|nr:MAG: quinolinate synthase NadA [Candidatus Cloacimonadota bacterium]